MAFKSYKMKKVSPGIDSYSTSRVNSIQQSTHVQNDQLQSAFFGLENRLKLLDYLENEYKSAQDPSVHFQLEDARQSIRRDLVALNRQGVSVSDVMARFGQKLMESKIVYANYILKRFGKPHQDFIQLFREQQEYEENLRQMKEKHDEKVISSASSESDLMYRLRELTENKMAEQLPITEKYGEIMPQQTIHKQVNEEAIEKAEEIRDNIEILPEVKEITEQTQTEAHEIKKADEKPQTIEVMKEELEVKRTPNLITKLETEDDVYKYAKQQNYFSKTGNLKNKGYVALLKQKIFQNDDLSYEQKKNLVDRAQALYHSKKKPMNETQQFIA